MKKLAVFASGRGSNFQTIFQHIREGYIPAQITALISDREKTGAAQFAAENRIPVFVVKPDDFPTRFAFGEQLLRILNNQQVEFVILAGYLKKIPENTVAAFENRIVNIHPALLPAFGGNGMYGMRVHRAVFNSGAKISGVTVHLVNNEYDAGPIVLQKCVDISDCPSPEAIAEKVLTVEHQVFPEAIKLLLENEYDIANNRVMIRKSGND